jgi:hypothetical protein
MLGFYPKRADRLLDGVAELVWTNKLTIIPLDHKTLLLMEKLGVTKNMIFGN